MVLTKDYLATLSEKDRSDAILKEFTKCTIDIRYCIEKYFTVDAGGIRKPFILYPHQVEALADYENYTNNITMKTRQMGFTTFTSAYIAYKMMFNRSFKVLIISKAMDDAKDFVQTIKDVISEVEESFPWLFVGYKPGYNNKESFTLNNGSKVKAQSTSEDAGRGMQGLKLLVCDEVAYIDRRSPQKMQEIWAAAGPALTTVRGKAIMISTPKGTAGWYYDTYTNAKKMGFHIIDAHWKKHPVFNMGTYRFVQDDSHAEGGYLKIYSKTWPESIFDRETGTYVPCPKEGYPFVRDGKLRSPWYDYESDKLGPEKSKAELDCSFMGTGGEVLTAEMLRDLRVWATKSPFKTWAETFANVNGIFKLYKEYIAPQPGKRYILGADVATGDGSDYSAFTIIDIETLDICATFKAQLLPDTFAKIIELAGRRYGNCPAIVENAGGGGTTLQTMKQDGYPNIYYSTLRKQDPSTGLKKRKIGLWPSEQVRWEGGDRLEQVIRNKKLKIHCLDLIAELNTWIWDKDGKRRHAPERNDDLIMATQHAIYYIFYVVFRADKNRKVFNKVFEIQRGDDSRILSENPQTANGSVVRRRESLSPGISGKYNKMREHSFNIDKESGTGLKQNTRFL